ncbi:unnamed protein product [Spirodela intermedia]|uniref:Uncharacterized protein n=1 Tax=Spirodela intermedia TaxID=51605 RepID=A0ABN7ECL8_SPIIN|nr:unnamed protein product [Spirodela intermedia]
MTQSLMKWVVELSPAAVTWRSGKMVTLRLSSGSKSFSRACMTTPCPTTDWPPVTWKGSGAHMPLSVQAARAPTRSYSPTALLTRLRARLAGRSPIL